MLLSLVKNRMWFIKNPIMVCGSYNIYFGPSINHFRNLWKAINYVQIFAYKVEKLKTQFMALHKLRT